jgi:hypothetical protein
MAGMDPVNVDAMLARFAEHWSPKKIAQVNDYDVRIVKLQGDFTWHKHDDTDELFLVLCGRGMTSCLFRWSSQAGSQIPAAATAWCAEVVSC